MPTVLRVADFVFYFFSGDHEPARGDRDRHGPGQAKGGEIRPRDVRRAVVIVEEHKDALQRAWIRHAMQHGG